MKESILVLNEDLDYSKRFCSKANRMYGDKYLFLFLPNLDSLKEYIKKENSKNLILSDSLAEKIDDTYNGKVFVLDEERKEIQKTDNHLSIYKFQNIKNILEIVDENIERNVIEDEKRFADKSKLVTFYGFGGMKGKTEIVRKIAKYLQKKRSVLIVDIDEFDNYKEKRGLSGIIFNYKEGKLDKDVIRNEIVEDRGLKMIKSVTYPEDFNVISSADLNVIINETLDLGFDYVFVNADFSYVKSQYIINDSSFVIFPEENFFETVDKVRMYLKNECKMSSKKLIMLRTEKVDRAYLLSFTKSVFGDKNG